MPDSINAGKVHLDVAFDGRQITRALVDPVQAAGRDVERQLSRSFGQSAQTAGRALTRNLTPAMVGLGAASLAAFAQVDGGLDAIRATTGTTGAELKALEQVAKDVGGTVTAGFAQVGQAVGDLAASTDLVGASLEAVTRQVLQLEQVGNAVSTTAVAQALQDWGVAAEDSAGQLDLLFRASQETGTPLERLLTLVKQYGAPLRELGFEVDEAAVLLGGFEEAGVNTELAMGGLRTALGKFAGAGRDPQQALQETFTAIENAGSSAEAAGIAIDVFGRRAGADLAQAIDQGRFSFEDMLATVAAGTDTIGGVAAETADWADKLKMLGNQAIEVVGPFGEIGFALSGVGAVAGPVLTGLGKVAEKLKSVAASGSTAGNALSSMGSLLAGPWGIAAAGAAIAIGAIALQHQRAEARAREYTAAIEADSGALAENTRETVANRLEHLGILEQAADLGISTALLVDAVLGEADARRQVNEQLERRNDAIGDTPESFNDIQKINRVRDALRDETAAIDTVVQANQRVQDAVSGTGVALDGLTAAQVALQAKWEDGATAAFGGAAALDVTAAALNLTALATRDAREAAASYNGHLDALESAAAAAAATFDVFDTALKRLLGVNISAEEAAINYLDSLDALSAAVEENGAALDLGTDAGRRNREAIIAVIEAANADIQARADQGASLAELGPRMEQHRQDLIAQATQAGFTTEEIEGLLTQYGLTPDTIATTFNTVGVQTAIDEARRFQQALAQVGDSLASVAADIGIHVSAGSGGSGGVTEAAAGGQIGSGFGTRDDVPALLTRGEVVQSVPAVRKWKASNLLALNAGMVPPGWHIPGFASGGEVLARAFMGNLATTELPQGFARALAFVAANVGDPYIWGGSGPNGFDCSGLQGSAAAVAKGANPYQRYFTTSSMIDAGGQFGFVPNLRSPFTIGVRKGNPGHMAGTILGVNVESTPPRVRMGPGARGASYGTHHFGLRLADGGMVNPLLMSLFPVGPGDPPFDLLNPLGRLFDPAFRRLVGLAGGGTVSKGGAFLVGEDGPEVALLRSGDAVATEPIDVNVVGVHDPSGAAVAGLPVVGGLPPATAAQFPSGRFPDAAEAQAAAAALAAEVAQNHLDHTLASLEGADLIGLLQDLQSETVAWSDDWVRLQDQIDAAVDEATDALTAMLAERDRILTRQADAVAQHRKRLAEMEAALAGQQAQLARTFAQQQQAALDARTASLDGSIRIDQRLAETWGNTTRALTRNLTAQANAFAEHRDLMFGLRARGLDEGLIAALGLDAGPQALGQIRALIGSTDAELAALDTAYLARSAQVAQTVQQESVTGATQLGTQLLDLQSRYAADAQALVEQHVAAVEALNEAQAALMRDLAAQMAAIGADMGMSTAEAIAAGLLSGIPAIVAAAQAAADALAAAGRPFDAKVSTPLRTAGIPGGRGGQTPGGFDAAAWIAGLGVSRRADNGMRVDPGDHWIRNASRSPEWIFRDDQIASLLDEAGGGGDVHVKVFIGDRDITDIVRVEAENVHRQRAYRTTAQAVR